MTLIEIDIGDSLHFCCFSGRREFVSISIKTASLKVVGDDNVSDSVKDELDVGGVGGACHVTEDLFGRPLVFGFKFSLNVGRCIAILLRPCKDITMKIYLKNK